MKANVVIALLMCFVLVGCSAKSTQANTQTSKRTACFVKAETTEEGHMVGNDALDLIKKKKIEAVDIRDKCSTIYVKGFNGDFMVHDAVNKVSYFGFENPFVMKDYEKVVGNTMRDVDYVDAEVYFLTESWIRREQ